MVKPKLIIPYLLSFSLVCPLILMVNSTEVRDNDRHGQGNDEHTGEGADAADYLAGAGCRYHVTVTVGERNKKMKVN